MSIEPEQTQASRPRAIPVDSFGNRLMLARAYAGHISIREAADLCDLGRGAWTNWEKGSRPADIIDTATTVAEKLGVDRDWLLFGGQLAEAESRPNRRSRGFTARYLSVADQSAFQDRPTDNRPIGRPDAGLVTRGGRTAYLDRARPRGRAR